MAEPDGSRKCTACGMRFWAKTKSTRRCIGCRSTGKRADGVMPRFLPRRPQGAAMSGNEPSVFVLPRKPTEAALARGRTRLRIEDVEEARRLRREADYLD